MANRFGDREGYPRRGEDEGYGRDFERGYDYQRDRWGPQGDYGEPWRGQGRESYTRASLPHAARGYGYGESIPGYTREGYQDEWTGRGEMGRPAGREGYYGGQYGEPPGAGYGQRGYPRVPVWSYTEFWLIPGPHTGRGPRGYERSDERILEEVCERLTQHGQLDASDMEVQVNNGEVTLRGFVDSRQAKRMAEDVAESVRGVRDVHNELRLNQPQQGQPRIQRRMEEGLQDLRESLRSDQDAPRGQAETPNRWSRGYDRDAEPGLGERVQAGLENLRENLTGQPAGSRVEATEEQAPRTQENLGGVNLRP